MSGLLLVALILLAIGVLMTVVLTVLFIFDYRDRYRKLRRLTDKAYICHDCGRTFTLDDNFLWVQDDALCPDDHTPLTRLRVA